MIRPESLRWWLAGLVVGTASLLVLLFTWVLGMPFVLVFVALGAVLARNLAFLSGAAIGFGGMGSLLLARAVLDCAYANLLPGQACVAHSIGPFTILCLVLLVAGIVLGLLARRRAEPTGVVHA